MKTTSSSSTSKGPKARRRASAGRAWSSSTPSGSRRCGGSGRGAAVEDRRAVRANAAEPEILVTFRHLEEGWVDTPEPRREEERRRRGGREGSARAPGRGPPRDRERRPGGRPASGPSAAPPRPQRGPAAAEGRRGRRPSVPRTGAAGAQRAPSPGERARTPPPPPAAVAVRRGAGPGTGAAPPPVNGREFRADRGPEADPRRRPDFAAAEIAPHAAAREKRSASRARSWSASASSALWA